MIIKLEQSNESVAGQIHTIFQKSYKIEAGLIGVEDFPPLLRTAKDIVNSKTHFYGFSDNHCLAAIIEIEVNGKHLNIHSLTVDPIYFKKGIASKLINYALTSFGIATATVETAVANEPAIKLYQKHGFREFKRWTPAHGIKKIALSYKLEA